MRADSSPTDLVVPRNNVLIEFNDSKFTLYVVFVRPTSLDVLGKSHSFAFKSRRCSAGLAWANSLLQARRWLDATTMAEPLCGENG